jgi:hypothetical protein
MELKTKVSIGFPFGDSRTIKRRIFGAFDHLSATR